MKMEIGFTMGNKKAIKKTRKVIIRREEKLIEIRRDKYLEGKSPILHLRNHQLKFQIRQT